MTGGELRDELDNSSKFQQWWQEALKSGRVKELSDDKEKEVRNRTKELIDERACVSNDHHIIALAQVSGVRFLYSDDADLHTDFRDKNLVDKPRGTVYSTKETSDFTPGHRRMLRGRMCRIR